jgi:hypothetical protein
VVRCLIYDPTYEKNSIKKVEYNILRSHTKTIREKTYSMWPIQKQQAVYLNIKLIAFFCFSQIAQHTSNLKLNIPK